MSASHFKLVILRPTRAQLLRELADICEHSPVDGPIVADYDLASGWHIATVYILDGTPLLPEVTPQQVCACYKHEGDNNLCQVHGGARTDLITTSIAEGVQQWTRRRSCG
jgi:hypothetical protein